MNKLFEEAHDDLAILITRTRQLKRLTLEFRSQLDPELASHCYVGSLENDVLTVYVDTAAWATRLRFQAPQLIPLLRQTSQAFAKLGTIRVSIVAHAHAPESPLPQSSGPVMSQDNANIINSLSNDIDDPSLQQALRRLARHAHTK